MPRKEEPKALPGHYEITKAAQQPEPREMQKQHPKLPSLQTHITQSTPALIDSPPCSETGITQGQAVGRIFTQ